MLPINYQVTMPELSLWTPDEAQSWYAGQPWLAGCNFIPSTAINQLEMWQHDSFDVDTIDRELGWASGLGFNTVRVFLHDLLWRQHAPSFLDRVERFLEIAARHGKSVVQLALRWSTTHPAVSVALAGCRNPAEVEENVGAFEFTLSEADLAEIDAVFAKYGIETAPDTWIEDPEEA